MRENKYFVYILLVVLSLAILVSLAILASLLLRMGEQEVPAPAPTPVEAPAPLLVIAGQAGHPALMELPDDGMFRPDGTVARGEMAQWMVHMLEGLRRSAGESRWTDLPAGDGRYHAVARLDAAGLLPEDDSFRPDDPLTRGELGRFMERLAERLAGEERARAAALAEELTGEDTLTRREAAAVLVELSGREMLEEDRLFLGGCVPSDMTRADEGWQAVADAVTAGRPAWKEPGLYRLYGWLYAVAEGGVPAENTSVGVWSFGPDGGYTTGNRELDGYLAQALEDSGANDLSGREALEAVYLYVKNNFEYKVTPLDQMIEEEGETGWECKRAVRFFRNGGGTCYGYAAAFGLLARCLGENAQIVAATVNQFNGPHSFVVIPDQWGTDWIYDVELEDTRPERHGDLDLFHIQNFAVYNYWYTPDW